MTATLITDPLTHLTTLSDDVLNGVRRPMRTPSGFKLNVPLPKIRAGAMETVRPYRTTSIARAISRHLNNGVAVHLPVANLVLRFYARHMTRTGLRALGRLKAYHERHPSEPFAHLRDFGGPSHGDWARMRWWGLIEPKPATGDQEKAPRGWWRLTGLGHRWLRGEVKVPRTPAMFDGVFVGWIDKSDLIGPSDVDVEFDLDQVLMRRRA